MAEIFGREIKVTIGDMELEGFRVRFRIHKDDTRDPNTCELEVENLSASQRARVSEFNPKEGAARGIPVKIEAGYKTTGGAELLWLGDLRTSISYKTGPTWVTKLGSGDGEASIGRSRVNASFGARTPVKTVIRAIVDSMGLGAGNLNAVTSALKAGNTGSLALDGAVLTGPSAYHLDNWCRASGLSWSIQDGVIQFLVDGGPLAGRSVFLSPETGLVGSPSLNADGELSASSFIIPGVHVGAVVVVESSTVKGNFQIKEADYQGDTHGPTWFTNISAKRY